MVLEGCLEIYGKNNDAEEVIIDTIHKGEMIGEVNFAEPIGRHFSVRTKIKSRVILYSYKKITELLKWEPAIAAKIYAAINDALVDRTIKITQKL